MLPLLAIGAGISALSSIYGGMKARDAYLDQAKAATYNAAFAKIAGARKAMRARQVGARRISEQRASYARSGVMVDAGTPLQMYADTAQEAELASQEILVDYQNQYAEYTAQANRLTDAGAAAYLKGGLGAMGTILSAYALNDKINPGPMGGLGTEIDTDYFDFDMKPKLDRMRG